MMKNEAKKVSSDPLVDKVIQDSRCNGFFDSGDFSIDKFAQNSEFRGLKNDAFWTRARLDMVTTAFRQYVSSHPTEPEKIDASLQRLAAKINVNIDRLRRCYYEVPESEPEKANEEPPFDDKKMNPALPTVLDVSGLTKEAWGALTNSAKKQIHDAVRDGKTDIAKKLAETALAAVPLIL